jgi:hypothetical protein
MDEIISYKMCAVKMRNATLRNYLKGKFFVCNDVIFGFQLTGRYNKKRLF